MSKIILTFASLNKYKLLKTFFTMGQYYRSCVLDKTCKRVIASLHPHSLNVGAKLTEHSYVGNRFVNAVTRLISAYNGHRFVWCGDYADEIAVNKLGQKVNAYCLAPKNDFDDVSEFCDSLGIEKTFKYIVNYTKREYVKVPDDVDDRLIFHPLPLLTAAGNGLGSGDYRGTNIDVVGSWAYDRIGVTNKRPHYRHLKVTFNE